MRRFLLILFLITLFSIISFVYISPYLLHYLQVDRFVQRALEQQLGRPIYFDSMYIHIIPTLSLTLRNARIKEKDIFLQEYLLKVRSVALNINVLPLLFKRVQVKKLVIRNMDVTIIERDGKFNIHELLLDQAKQAAEQAKGGRGGPEIFDRKDSVVNFVISKLAVHNVNIFYKQYDAGGTLLHAETVADIDGYFKNISLREPIDFKLKGIPAEGEEHLHIKGTLQLDTQDMLKHSSLHARLTTDNFTLDHVLATYVTFLPQGITSGMLSCTLDVTKASGEQFVNVNGTVEVKKCPLEGTTTVRGEKTVDTHFDIDVGCSLPLESIKVRKLKAAVASSDMQLEGEIDIKAQSLKMRSFSKRTNIWDIPYVRGLVAHYLPPWLRVGGTMAYDIVVSGTFFKQKIRGTIDYTANELTMTSVYKKAPGYPLLLELDLGFEAQQSLSGDFNVAFGSATIKGNVRDLDFATSEFECTLLSNKFAVAPLSQSVLMFDDITIDGDAKIFANAKGSFRQPETVKFNVGVTLNDVRMKQGDLSVVQQLNAFISVDQHNIEISEVRGGVLDSAFNGWLRIQNYKEKPIVNFDIYSSHCNVDTILAQSAALMQSKTDGRPQAGQGVRSSFSGTPQRTDADSVSPFFTLDTVSGEGAFYLNTVLFRNATFNEVKGVIQLQDGVINFDNIDAKGFEGHMTASGTLDLREKPIAYRGLTRAEALNLDQVFRFVQNTTKEGFISGTINSNATISGRGFTLDELEQYLSGQGQVQISDGQLKNIDILQAISTVQQLFGLKKHSYGSTRFNDIDTTFVIENGKVRTDKIELASDDFTLTGGGSLSLRGDLDYKVDVFLSPQLSQKILKQVKADEVVSIPLAITGTVEKPRYSVTGTLVRSIVDRLIEKGLRNLFDIEEKETQPAPKKSAPIVREQTQPVPQQRRPIQDTSPAPIAKESSEPQPTQTEQEEAPSRDELIEDAIRIGLDFLLKKDQ